MNYVGLVLAVLAGTVIGLSMPKNSKQAIKNVKKSSKIIKYIQEKGSQKIRGDRCGGEAGSFEHMGEQYDCTIDMLESEGDLGSIDKVFSKNLQGEKLLSISNIGESELAELLFQCSNQEPELARFASDLMNNSRLVASKVKSKSHAS